MAATQRLLRVTLRSYCDEADVLEDIVVLVGLSGHSIGMSISMAWNEPLAATRLVRRWLFCVAAGGVAAFSRSRPLRQEWWALNSDPTGPRWVMFLMALDLFVFLDYGHWRFAPWLVRPALQSWGLALYLAVTAWQIWTDACLARYFNQSKIPLVPMNRGPFRYMRHPRYAAAMIGKIAMALIFASVLGWTLAVAWGVLLLNEITIEERHLRKLFGSSYDSYAHSTAKVIPGIY